MTATTRTILILTVTASLAAPLPWVAPRWAAAQPAAELSAPAAEAEAGPGEADEATEAVEAPDAPPKGVYSDEGLAAESPGQADFDRALEIKITASDLSDLNEVIERIDAAFEKGLEAGSKEIAQQVLVATLLQRASSLSSAVLGQPVPDPRQDPRWLQIRQFALTDLQRVVSLDESQAEGWFLIGRLQSLPMGSKSEARRALSKVIRLAEEGANDPEAILLEPDKLAQAYALRGAAQEESEPRLADLGRAIEIEPDTAEYRLLRSRAYQEDGHPEKCLEDIDHALSLEPNNAKVHEMRALALLMQDKPEEALESFNRASEIAPELLSPYQYRGEVFSRMGQLDEAISQLDKALELSPNNLASLLIRAELLMSDEQAERALADVETVLELSPGLVRAHLMKARALDALGREDEAVAWLERLAEVEPGRADLQLQLAAYYVDRSLAAPAIRALTRVIELDEGNELAHRLRGDMYLLVGKHAEAVADFAAVERQSPNDAGVLNNYAWTLATSPFDALRDGAKAVELAKRACEATDYARPHILSTLAASYAESGDFEQAIHWSQEAINKADEQGVLDSYDGQLAAELDSYRAGEPWRELQQQGEEGQADAADPPADSAESDPAEGADEPPASRSFDF